MDWLVLMFLGQGGVLFWGVCDWWIGGVCVLFFLLDGVVVE